MKKIILRYHYSLVLLVQLVKTDFKLRYQNSVLGYLWSLLRPLAIFVILYFVFVRFLRVGEGTPNFPIYLLLGIVLWNFFIEMTQNSVGAIVAKGDLIRKINFPKYVIVLSGSISALINLGLNLLVVLIFMIVTGVDIRRAVLVFPILILELYVFSLAVSFFLSATFVKLRDISYIWEIVMQGAFYATPILYPLALPVPEIAQKMMLLNPVAQIIQDSRFVIVTEKARTFKQVWGSDSMRIVPLAIVLLTIIVASFYFKKNSKFFAENV